MDVIIAALSLIEFIVYLLAMKEKVHIASDTPMHGQRNEHWNCMTAWASSSRSVVDHLHNYEFHNLWGIFFVL